jgi:aromatic-L-amino-acid decarboxylase
VPPAEQPQAQETLDPADWEAMRALGHRMLDEALDYMQSLRDRPVWQHASPEVKAHFAAPAPVDGEPAESIYQEYLQYIRPHQLGNNHPRFWGWVAGTGTVMGMLAELLRASTNGVSGGFAYMSSNYVEMQVLAWCKQLLGYPAEASGLLTSGGSASNLIGLAVARNTAAGFDVRKLGLHGSGPKLTLYCSDEAHSSVQKDVELLGLGSDSIRRIPVNDAMQIEVSQLEAAIRKDLDNGLHPFCVVGACGTTNTGSVDDLPALASICKEHGLWFHVDGAFGAWAAIAPKYKHLVRGLELADSLAIDLHKWMYIPYAIGAVFVRDPEAHEKAFSLAVSYLAHGEGDRGLTGVDVPWLSDYGYELSRSFQALKAWMTIKEQGTAKYARVIQKNIEQAYYLGDLVKAAPELELAVPVALNVCCFRYVRPGLEDVHLDTLNKQIVAELHERGIAAPSVVVIRGRSYLHVANTNHRSLNEDFDLLVRQVVRIGNAMS